MSQESFKKTASAGRYQSCISEHEFFLGVLKFLELKQRPRCPYDVLFQIEPLARSRAT